MSENGIFFEIYDRRNDRMYLEVSYSSRYGRKHWQNTSSISYRPSFPDSLENFQKIFANFWEKPHMDLVVKEIGGGEQIEYPPEWLT